MTKLKTSVIKHLNVIKFIFFIDKVYFFFNLYVNLLSGLLPFVNVYLTRSILNNIHTVDISLFKSHLSKYLIFLIFQMLFIKLTSILGFKIRNKFIFLLDSIILSKSKHIDLEDYENSAIYNTIRQIFDQSDKSVANYFEDFLNVIKSFLIFITNSYFLFELNAYLIVLIISFSILKSIVNLIIGNKSFELYKLKTPNEREKWYYKFIYQNENTYREIKSNNAFNFFIKKYKIAFNKVFKLDYNLLLSTVKLEFIPDLLDIFSAIALLVMIYLNFDYLKISFGSIISYTQSFQNIKSSVETLFYVCSSLSTKYLYVSIIIEFLNKFNDNHDDVKNMLYQIDSIETIEIENLSFQRNDKFILDKISYKFERGNHYLIVGANGSGKTSLAKILSGLYKNIEGNIIINGRIVDPSNFSVFRNKINVLFQDSVQFELTLRENLIFDKAINDKKIKSEIYKISPNLLSLFDFNDRIGFWFDYGKQPSGGEWQKIAFIRSVLNPSDVYIFDEPTNYLDGVSKEKIHAYINNLSVSSIVIHISHDYNYIMNFNGIILMLNNGKIVKSGSYNELEKDPIFRKLILGGSYE